MLTRTLCCFKGISAEAERSLWRKGCLSWRHLALSACRHFSAAKAEAVAAQVPLCEAALDARAADFFIGRLPCGHKLRILPEFKDDICYLDIETTGLERRAMITVIGLWRRGKVETFVRGRNLHDFVRVWKDVGALVTFNGARFDLPFIMREFGFSVHPPHIDLLCESRAYGHVGGLKGIERKLGYIRSPDEDGDGVEAVRLWHEYTTTADETVLRRLVAYNTRDVLSLILLAQHLWRISCQNYNAPLPEV